MKSSILWQGLSSLTFKEGKRFLAFIQSPYFNQREEVTKLGNYLFDCVFHLKIVPSKKNVYHAVCKGVFSDQELRLNMSYLTKLLEKFWTVESSVKRNEIDILKFLRERNLTKHYNAKLRKVKSVIEDSEKVASIDDYFYKYKYFLESYEAIAVRDKPLDLHQINLNFDLYYFLNRLRFSCDNLLNHIIHDLPNNSDLDMNNHLDFISESGLMKHFYIRIYYHIYNFLIDLDNQDSFQKYSQELKLIDKSLDKNELLRLYGYGLNYCNFAKGDYTQESFALYREGLKFEIFTSNGHIDKFYYRNISGLAIRVGEIKWAENFIEDYKSLILEQDREGSYHLNKAVLAFHLEKYDDCLFHLQEADYKDKWFALAAKCGICKCYVELNESDALHYALNAMEQFVRRNNVGHLKDGYLNFIRITRLFDKHKMTTPHKIETLKSRIEASENLVEKNWLLDKVNLIIK